MLFAWMAIPVDDTQREGEVMKKAGIIFLVVAIFAPAIAAQTIAFGFGDPVLEANLTDIGASAKIDLPGFQAEISLTWGIPKADIQVAMTAGLPPAEVYLASALAGISGKSLAIVVEMYKKDKDKGWGALAKELGIKPGSKEFKALKDKTSGSAEKAKKKKK